MFSERNQDKVGCRAATVQKKIYIHHVNMSFAGGHTKPTPNKSLLNAKRKKKTNRCVWKEGSKQVGSNKKKPSHKSFFL